jgi:hypothetical protein
MKLLRFAYWSFLYNEAQESQKKSVRRPNSEVKRLNVE